MKIPKYLIPFFAFLLVSLTNYSQSNGTIDSLINVVKTQAEDTTKVNNLNALCEGFKSNPDTAEYYGNLALSAAQRLNFSKGEALAYKNLGNIFYRQSNYTKAYELYNKSLAVYEKINDKQGIAIIVRNLGSIYHQQGNYNKALEYFFRSLNARIEIDDKKGIANLYNAIGLVFWEQVDDNPTNLNILNQNNEFLNKALEYFDKALEMYKKLEDNVGIAQTYYRISSIYKQKQKEDDIKKRQTTNKNDTAAFESSNIYLKKALEYSIKFKDLSEKIGDVRLLAEANSAMGDIYMDNKEYNKALQYFNKSLELYHSINSQTGLANIYLLLGRFYYMKKQIPQSISFYTKALQISKEIQVLVIGRNSALSLYQNYKELGDFKNALFFYETHIELKDSLVNEEKKNEIAKLEMNMEFQQQLKQKEMEQQKLNFENEEELKRQRLLLYFFVVAFLLMIGLAYVIFRSYRSKQKANLILEEKNQEILQQKQHIMDSIVYAKRIQDAILPPEEFISHNFNEHFVLFKPRDIVSGDFYWAAKNNNLSIIAAADSTGHGVPGAFMSMLGISLLNEIVNREEAQNLKANEVLNELRSYIKKSLRQTGKEDEAQDGMDIALCIFDYENYTLQYAGAYNPLLLIRNKEMIQYKADRMPVGIYYREKGSFTNHKVVLQKGDQIYIFSDGFIDQFGGNAGEKFLTKRFKSLLLENSDKSMKDQKHLLLEAYENWTNPSESKAFEQLDDILIIGIKVE